MSTSKGKLFVFAAPSGAGKTTLVRDVLANFSRCVFSISVTTRKKRETEIDGKDYLFVTEKEFLEKIKNNELVEWEKLYDYYYGTPKDFIDGYVAEGTNVVFDVDVKGAVSIKKFYPEAVLIFVSPPSVEALKERLVKRKTETDEDLKKRIERAEMEMSYRNRPEFDYIVYNIELEKAKSEIKRIIENKINKEN